MSKIRIILRVEIEQANGEASSFEIRRAVPATGGNPRFFGQYVEQAAPGVVEQIVESVEAAHGTRPVQR